MSITLNAATRSNRDWKTQFQFTDADTNVLIDFTGAFIAIGVYDNDGCQRILATTTNGLISIVSTGIIDMDIPYTSMTLEPGSYDIGAYYQLSGETIDLFAGELSVQKGIPQP